MELNSIREKVAYILETVPHSRYDDNLLLAIYWQLYDDVSKIENINKATKAETIMRNRRKICNADGLQTINDVEE